jgi:hypothetical protein
MSLWDGSQWDMGLGQDWDWLGTGLAEGGLPDQQIGGPPCAVCTTFKIFVSSKLFLVRIASLLGVKLQSNSFQDQVRSFVGEGSSSSVIKPANSSRRPSVAFFDRE